MLVVTLTAIPTVSAKTGNQAASVAVVMCESSLSLLEQVGGKFTNSFLCVVTLMIEDAL